jgi:hypothetical protein
VANRAGLASAASCLLLLAASGCTSPEPSALETYTDPGDGCQQAISAIGFADDVLKPLGQEHYQVFDDEVRSKLAAVEGQLALEAHDWPSGDIREQADVVQELARRAAVKKATAERERALLEYRGEAARLVLLCRDALDAGQK